MIRSKLGGRLSRAALNLASFEPGPVGVRYGVIVTIDSGDTATAVRDLVAGLVEKAIRRDHNKDQVAKRHTLGLNRAAQLTINNRRVEIELVVYIGYNAADDPTARNEIAEFQRMGGLVRQMAFNPTLTRSDMLTALNVLANSDGCALKWTVQPGDNVSVISNTSLLAKFA